MLHGTSSLRGRSQVSLATKLLTEWHRFQKRWLVSDDSVVCEICSLLIKSARLIVVLGALLQAADVGGEEVEATTTTTRQTEEEEEEERRCVCNNCHTILASSDPSSFPLKICASNSVLIKGASSHPPKS